MFAGCCCCGWICLAGDWFVVVYGLVVWFVGVCDYCCVVVYV